MTKPKHKTPIIHIQDDALCVDTMHTRSNTHTQYSITLDNVSIINIDEMYGGMMLYPVSADNATIQPDFQPDRTRQPCKRAGGHRRRTPA